MVISARHEQTVAMRKKMSAFRCMESVFVFSFESKREILPLSFYDTNLS